MASRGRGRYSEGMAADFWHHAEEVPDYVRASALIDELGWSLEDLIKALEQGHLHGVRSRKGGHVHIPRQQFNAQFTPVDAPTMRRSLEEEMRGRPNGDGFRYYRDVARALGRSAHFIRSLAVQRLIPSTLGNTKANPKRRIWNVRAEDVLQYCRTHQRISQVSDVAAFQEAQRIATKPRSPTTPSHLRRRTNPITPS